MLIIDIDHFKSVNDSYGHLAGDEVLKQVAARLPAGVRSYDWVGRYGGEEFVVIVSNCSADTVAICAERLRAGVAAEPVRIHGEEIKITVSVGTALAMPGCGPAFEDLLQVADDALYRAKENGRNCVELGGSSMATSRATTSQQGISAPHASVH